MDLHVMYERLKYFGLIASLVMISSFVVTVAMAATFQKQISAPILALADTAKVVSESKDYSVRAKKYTDDELGRLTETFNHMLGQIEERDIALRESEERFRRAIAEAPIPIMIYSEHGEVLQMSEGWTNWAGYTAEDFLENEDWIERVYGSRSQFTQEYVDNLFEGNQTLAGGEWTITAKDGQRRIWNVYTTPLGSGSHGKRMLLRLGVDLTDRKKAEEVLKVTATELARSNSELEQFAYVASHDLQEPLRAVGGCVQLLKRRYQSQIDSSADELIMHSVDGVTRMQGLISDLLLYSRVGTRGKPLEPTDCAVILKHTLDNLQVSIHESGTRVTSNALPTVNADATQLTQLLQNLIGNAIKYRDGRSPEIHLGVTCDENEWLFSVRDNGIGIEPQYYERVFKVFQRLHQRREYAGNGIGLAICKKIVERHGGRIWVDSKLGEGSTFYFTISKQERNS
jgi:PAS domain S-box-containing protein